MDSLRLLWKVLEPWARRQLFILLVLTTLSGFVEVLSVGLIIPFIAVAAGSLPFGKANLITRSLIGMVHTFGVSERHTTAALGVVFCLGVILANTYLCCYQYYAARVINRQRDNFGVRALKAIMQQPLEWLDRENSADLIKILMTDVGYVAALMNAMVQVCAILTRCVVVYLFFLITQARLAIFLAVSMATLYLLVFRFVQRPTQRAGAAAQDSHAQMFRTANEVIGGSRTLRATATEQNFFRRYQNASERSIYPQVFRVMPAYLSRAGLETATVLVVVTMLIYFNAKDGNLANGLPLLSSYAVAGIRLLPSVQQALVYYLEIKFYRPSLVELARVVQLPCQRDFAEGGPLLAFQKELTLDQVSYGYGADQQAVESANLTIEKNKRVAFVGETGAGKSTIIDLILALRYPTRGEIRVDGQPIGPKLAVAWRRLIGYVPQSIYLLDASIAENIAFGLTLQEIDPVKLRRACEAASLSEFIETLPDGYETFVGERGVRLSGGQCQRIGIARALYHEPEIFIFDEATSALDSVTENLVLEALDRLKGNKTLIVIAHRLNTVWDFDQIFVMEQGRVVGQGTAQELLASNPVFARLAEHQVNLQGSE